MLLSLNLIRVHDAYGIYKTLDLFSEAGFEGIDFNNDLDEYYSDEHNKEFYSELANYARGKGISICQAHAPFPSSFPEEEKTEKRFYEIVEGMKNAAYLGAPMIVVHPCTHLDYEIAGNPERLFDFNLNFYKRLAPYAKELGIKIAIENIGLNSITSTPERLNRLYDTLNDSVFTICFDVGHCLLQGVDPADAIIQLGHRLADGCTHVHDNLGDRDSHTLPFYGKVDWESVMKALSDINYRGDLNYEASNFLKTVPTELFGDGLVYMAKVGHYMISRFEYYKNQNN